MTQQTPLPRKTPPHPSSIYTNRTRYIVTMLSYLLGYYSEKWLDEAIIGFLSILSSESKPFILFNFSQFLVDAIHKQFINFTREEVFRYSSKLVYMFVYSQVHKFQFVIIKLNEEGEAQSVVSG